MWLGSNNTRLLESGATTTKKQRGRSLQKDREMGEKTRVDDETLRPITKQVLIWNYGWEQPIFIHVTQKGRHMENMAEIVAKTQTTHLAKLLL